MHRVLTYRKLGLVCLLLLAACQDTVPGRCRMARVAEVPLRLGGGHLLIDTVLDGAPTTMVLDTGAQMTTITRQAADRLHLAIEQRGYFEGIGGRQTGYQFTSKTFQLGRLHGQHLPLMAGEMGSGQGRGFADGLFGDDFLAAYDLDLDLPEHQAILYTRIEGCSAPSVFLTGALYELPILSSYNPNDHRPRIRVEIGGKTLRALVDSGAPHTLIFRDAARRVGLNLTDLANDPHIHVGGVGPYRREGVRHVLAPVTVGDLTVRNMPAAIIDESSLGGDEMLLGLDFMLRVHLWFSFSSHTLIMQFPPTASPPSPT